MSLPVENDPFEGKRADIEKQARTLYDDLQSGAKSSFSAGNKQYKKTVINFQTSTKAFERWPKNGSETIRETSFIGRRIMKAAICYPFDRGSFLVVALRFRSYDPDSMDQVGQVNISRREKKTDFDIATYDRGVFSSFKKDGRSIKGEISEEKNQVHLGYEDGQVRFDGRIPYRFNLGELGILMLGEDPNKLRERYVINHSRISKFDERLFSHLPQGQACLDTCLANGWLPRTGDIVRLVRLWDEVHEGRRTDGVKIGNNRLKFARWLITHGRISDQLAS